MLSKLAKIILRDDSNDGIDRDGIDRDGIDHDGIDRDGIDRRGFLECMAWAGTGVVWTIAGGVPSSRAFGQKVNGPKGELSFVQISDSHMGFNKPANPDVTGTLQATIEKINALPSAPEFIVHTGDLSHLSKPSEFDTLDQVLKSSRQKNIFFVPGEHDTAVDDGKQYLERYGKGTKGRGWYSHDYKGIHFVGLVNVGAIEGLGKLGPDQLAWLESDLKATIQQHARRRLRAHTSLVVVSRLGLGDSGQRGGAHLSQALWLCHRAKWAYPPGDAESGRQRLPFTQRCPRPFRNPRLAAPRPRVR